MVPAMQREASQLTAPGPPGRFNQSASEAVSKLNTSRTPFVSAMKVHRPTRPVHLALIKVAFLLVVVATHEEALGQSRATVAVEENLRAEPQGTVIGRFPVGSTLPVLQVQGRWVQVEVQGWIWSRSIQATDRQGFDLAVSLGPQENIRGEPSGAILGRLLEGALLEKVDEVPGWTQVRRVAWMWGPSLELEDKPPSDSGTSQPGIQEGEGWWRSGSGGAPILAGPDGDTLARALPEVELQLLARQGNWVRVRLEGWTWAPAGMESDSASAGVVSTLTLEEVAQDPEAYRGQVVAWELQFVSIEAAERVRTDFYEGEPFLLTRASSPGRAFVYVAIPPERVHEVEGLIPLERIRVVGRIRTGSAALTGNPILDLLEFTRLPGG